MSLKLYQGLGEVPPGRRAVALGTFDGVHLGHRAVVAAAVAAATRLEAIPCAATFHPRPAVVVRPGTPAETLAGVTQRVRLLGEAGAEEVVILRFDRAMAALDARQFVEQVLVERLGAVAVSIGEDFRFGADRAGDVRLLRSMGEECGFEVEAVGIIGAGEDRISSSRIRALVRDGKVGVAANLLGRPPSLEGAIVCGDARGRELGYPTANLSPVPGQCHPAEGVYAGWAITPPGERRHPAAISVGRNPQFGETESVRVEAHLLDYAGDDLYGIPMRLEFSAFVRPQATFESVAALVARMDEDVAEVRHLLRAGD
jgi:riboflavin kinase/FMN adenylyltransferase